MLLFVAFFSVVASFPLIIDTDIGTDMDDSWAIAIAISDPNVDLRLILTATHNTTARAKIVAKYLTRVGKANIPIGVGVTQANDQMPLQTWADDFNLSSYKGPLYLDGVSQAIKIIDESAEPTTILAIAPLPNFQAILSRRPDLAKKIIIKAMSGSINICYNGAPGACPEYNVFDDIPAAKLTYATSWNSPMTTAPIDVGYIAEITGDEYQRLIKAAPTIPIVSTLIECYTYWSGHGGSGPDPKTASTTLWDPVALYLTIFDSSLLEFQQIPISVSDKGDTIRDTSGQPVKAAVNWVNGTKGRDMWATLVVDTLTQARFPIRGK